MYKPTKTCFLVIPDATKFTDLQSIYDYAVEYHDHYTKVIADSICTLACTEYFHTGPGIWLLNGYSDWAGVLQESLDDAGLQRSKIAPRDGWLTETQAKTLTTGGSPHNNA